jgi:hypothetical protein
MYINSLKYLKLSVQKYRKFVQVSADKKRPVAKQIFRQEEKFISLLF